MALALVFFGTRVPALYQSLAMLVFALSMHYMPLAVGPDSGALLQISPRIEEAARGRPGAAGRCSGRSRAARPGGVIAGAALVFLHAMKELPATLLLAPIGFETLATDICRQTGKGFFEAAAVPASSCCSWPRRRLYLLNEQGVTQSS